MGCRLPGLPHRMRIARRPTLSRTPKIAVLPQRDCVRIDVQAEPYRSHVAGGPRCHCRQGYIDCVHRACQHICGSFADVSGLGGRIFLNVKTFPITQRDSRARRLRIVAIGTSPGPKIAGGVEADFVAGYGSVIRGIAEGARQTVCFSRKKPPASSFGNLPE